VVEGPYDLSLVEGSITTPDEEIRIREVRRQSRRLVTIGACATSGGIQALRNYAEVTELARYVYPRPDYIKSLATSTGIHEHVPVDYELRGCPINKQQLLEVLVAFLAERSPRIANESVCAECKRKGNECIMVSHGVPCMGPVTQSGCGALCPSYNRGCYGCFGPKENANLGSLTSWWQAQGVPQETIIRLLRTFNTWAPAFRQESERLESEGATRDRLREIDS
jgi:coenzyme F420-reducing hydrogenase gamma subunit